MGGWWWWNQSGGWIIILSDLIIRDLKVSNLLMTDKGCVKIGESPPPPSLRAPLQLLLCCCRGKTHSNICATILYLRIHFSHFLTWFICDWRIEKTHEFLLETTVICTVCWRDCFCFQLILGWPGCMGFHSSPWPPEWSHYGEWNLLLIDICSRYVVWTCLILH